MSFVHSLAHLLEPEEFIDDLQVFLGLRSAYWRLQRDTTRAGRNSVIAQLWNIALRIEDGNLTDAERSEITAGKRFPLRSIFICANAPYR